MNNINKLFNALVSNDENTAQTAFDEAIAEKLKTSMEVKKVAVTANIFNSVKNTEE